MLSTPIKVQGFLGLNFTIALVVFITVMIHHIQISLHYLNILVVIKDYECVRRHIVTLMQIL